MTRLRQQLAEGQDFRNPGRDIVAVSPDGSQVVYSATGGLYLRRHQLAPGSGPAGARTLDCQECEAG